MAFDPDAYLAKKRGQSPDGPNTSRDVMAALSSDGPQTQGGFDPDAYLATRRAPVPEQTKERGVFGKTWDALAVPAEKAKEGLSTIAQMVPITQAAIAAHLGVNASPEPTGNVVRDVVAGYPKIAAETMADVAPGFINRTSLVAPVALKGAKVAAPAIKGIGKGVAKAAEALSGLEHKTPGVLTEAANDPFLIFGQGTKKAGKLFDEMMDKGRIRKSFGRLKNEPLIDEALAAADNGTLTPEEALVARQTLDASKKSYPRFAYRNMRDTFDAVAKTKSAEADKAFSRAVRSDALRMPLATNKHGGTSAFKLGGGAVTGTVPLMSPALQGIVASLLGIGAKGASAVARTPVSSGTSIGALYDLISRNQPR